MSPITTHVLDTTLGKPARGIAVVVEIGHAADQWTELASAVTDGDGRIAQFAPSLTTLAPGVYRVRFFTGAYFRAMKVAAFYPEVDVIVQIDDPDQHYHIHVPLLLSPFGYTTYRGS
jgi:5-hydroxyisourate hydrolase